MNKIIKLFSVFLLLSQGLLAQKKTGVYGHITDTSSHPLEGVSIFIENYPKNAISDENGYYFLEFEPDTAVIVRFFLVGYKPGEQVFQLKVGESMRLNKSLIPNQVNVREVTIEDQQNRLEGINKINPRLLTNLPNASGNFESIIKTMPGVSSNNELSSQYSVRGGNYDENLVYVNDIEIHRPFLVHSGQQEGLSFINSDMVSNVKFSAGGFDARYGDKMSSVLDITYKTPRTFAGSAMASLLGGSLNLEGASKNRRWTYLMGARQKSNQFLLNSLDTKGDYKPSFTDIQTYITYTVNEKWDFALLGNYSRNKYVLIPQDRETSFGVFNEILRLKVFFEGQEIDSYDSGTGAFTTNFTPNKNLKLKFIASAYQSVEQENFDIKGEYLFDEIETDFSKSNFGKVRANRGIGAYQNHARNYLVAQVSNLEQRGIYYYKKSLIQWGVKYQHEEIIDKLSEWNLEDSAGYATPNTSPEVALRDVVKSNNKVYSNRYSAFLQNSFALNTSNTLKLTIGLRSTFWDYSKEWNISPRGTFSYKPKWKADWVFRASSGIYDQPPFYREMRDISGKLNTQVKAQRAIHYVFGADYGFKAWGGRPFRFTSELYYKQLQHLIPYEIDNVRIRYYANNSAHGYAAGIDFKLNGEFVKDLESWFTLSILKTEEDIQGDSYYKKNADGDTIGIIYPGNIPRPADQRVTFSIFFQDKLLKNPSNKVHLNLVFGSGLPIGTPDNNRFGDTLRLPRYQRVDIGFSKEFIGKRGGLETSSLKYFKSLTLYLEVFNLLKIANTVSYTWIRDVTQTDNLYAVPNYLTGRIVNFKVVAKF